MLGRLVSILWMPFVITGELIHLPDEPAGVLGAVVLPCRLARQGREFGSQ